MAQYRVWAEKNEHSRFLQVGSEEEAIETIAAIYRINKTELKAARDSPYSVAPQVVLDEFGKTCTFSGKGLGAVAHYSITYEPLNGIVGVTPKTTTTNTAADAWAIADSLQRSDEKVIIRRFGREIGWEELRDEALG